MDAWKQFDLLSSAIGYIKDEAEHRAKNGQMPNRDTIRYGIDCDWQQLEQWRRELTPPFVATHAWNGNDECDAKGTHPFKGIVCQVIKNHGMTKSGYDLRVRARLTDLAPVYDTIYGMNWKTDPNITDSLVDGYMYLEANADELDRLVCGTDYDTLRRELHRIEESYKDSVTPEKQMRANAIIKILQSF